MKRLFFATLAALAALALPVRAQFLGYTSPQTVNQQIFNAVNTTQTSPLSNSNPAACQTIPISTPACAIPNLGQSIHYVTIRSSSTRRFRLTLEGSNDGLAWFAMAESSSDSGSNGGTAGFAGFAASGSFAAYRLNLQAGNGSGSLQVWYSGTSVSNGLVGGSLNLSAQYRRILAIAPNTDLSLTAQQVNVYPPAGNTGGTLYFSFASNNCAGGSLVIQAGPDTQHLQPLTTITPANVLVTLQAFPIPAINAAAMAFAYTACGTETYDTLLQFAGPNVPVGPDPCASTGVLKQSVPINVTTATTTQLIPLVTGQTIYACGVSMTIAPSATSADTATFEYGTGASCGTGTTALTGAFGAGDLTTAAPPLFVTFADPGTTIKTASGNALCLLSAGNTVNIQGVLTYVQQ